jgi:hypothetical protein
MIGRKCLGQGNKMSWSKEILFFLMHKFYFSTNQEGDRAPADIYLDAAIAYTSSMSNTNTYV